MTLTSSSRSCTSDQETVEVEPLTVLLVRVPDAILRADFGTGRWTHPSSKDHSMQRDYAMRAERNKQEAPDWTLPVVKAYCRRQTSIGHTPEVSWPTSVNEHQMWRYVVSVDEQQCLTCDQWWSEAVHQLLTEKVYPRPKNRDTPQSRYFATAAVQNN